MRKITIVRNGNKEYYVECSFNNITKYSDVVEITQKSTHCVIFC